VGYPHGYRHSLRPGRIGLGRRAGPLGLKVFLTALAIVDDLVAVTVIALFYTSDISWTALAVGAAFLVALAGANIAGVGKPLVYGLLGIG
jgi:Na+:H+ antiporter, NhaA family